ncbi:unnamed protein product [Peniophora sp. CBMAI 1063]|nr:unnamed protein product [Peniophora sp. CBMAI 1063]
MLLTIPVVLHLSTLSAYYLSSVKATDNLSIPDAWQKTSNMSRDTRGELVYDAAATLAQNVNPLSGTTTEFKSDIQELAGFFAVLALQDYYSADNTSWHTEGVDTLKLYIQNNGLYGPGLTESHVYADVIYWGLVAFYSYRSYREGTLLDLAKEAYNVTYQGFITPDIATQGSGATRNVSFAPSTPGCGKGRSSAGGVFSYAGIPNDTEISIWSTGPFMTLSAYLFEETNDTHYQQAAQLSVDFLTTFMWNGSVVADKFYPTTCNTSFKPLVLNQAWFIEGLSVWANVTKNDTLVSFLGDVIANVTTFPGWTSSPGGVLNPANLDSDAMYQDNPGLLVRSLTEVYMRTPGTELSRYIEAYLTVQFNALSHRQLLGPNASFYSQTWVNPGASSFDVRGSIAAVDALNAGYALAPTTSRHRPTNKSAKIRTVIGAVIGGVCAAIIALLAALVFRRHRQLKHTSAEGDTNSTENVNPFLSHPTYRQTTKSSEERALEMLPTSQSMSQHASIGDERALATQALGADDEMAELPTLVRRLNNLLSRGRQPMEPPPSYEQ